MKDLVGKWKLINYSKWVNNKFVYWQGHQFGELIYKPNGTMRVNIQRSLLTENNNPLDNLRKKLWYEGHFIIDTPYVIKHHIKEASIKKRVGTTLTRKYLIYDDYLFINGYGLDSNVHLSWKKL